jgi:serine/threonine protein kinase
VDVDEKDFATLGSFRFDVAVELREALGRGTTAVVKTAGAIWAMCDPSEQETVAVKCVQSSDDEVHQFVLEEYRLLQELRHESIISVQALYMNTHHSLMIMELCDSTLNSHVEACGPVSCSQGKPWIQQLLSAVAFLHSRRIVHRDIKPENLLLKRDQLKLTDFNSAARIGSKEPGSMLSARGTQHYTAPEVLAGRLWNERVDIWSSGLSVFFMLHGNLPWDARTLPADTLRLLLTAEQLPDISWNVPCHQTRHVVQQCLTLNMYDRPPAVELLQHPLFETPLVRMHSGPLHIAAVPAQSQRRWSGVASNPCTTAKEVLALLQLHKSARMVEVLTAQDSEQGG